jgi:D-alanyl-D-alanine carboxypeptidase/D-alanyl-D-alanine-endopeptidase (penicillin-binding protein 4)
MLYTSSGAQSIAERLAAAIQQFESDPSMRHAIISLYVADAKTGKKLYAHNEQVGLAAASTQKLFTSAAAFELLGKDYRYKTALGYTGTILRDTLNGNLYIIGSGDPTFGSWRWKETNDTLIMQQWAEAVKKAGIHYINGRIIADESKFTHQPIPDGWIWQDIGNYYGAGAYSINWHENQYDLLLRSGEQKGDNVEVTGSKPASFAQKTYVNELSAGAKGSGDNAYIYFKLAERRHPVLRGTIPAGETSFTISGASPDPASDLLSDLAGALKAAGVNAETAHDDNKNARTRGEDAIKNIKPITFHLSPPLDSMNYYFLRRSINLYGEALVKTFALEKNGLGDTDKGIDILRDFWSANGIEKSALHIIDGSGLSPQNRVTTAAEVKVLQYARTRPWFQSFYHALPLYNGMKMKSGSIGGARAFAGYHQSKGGKEYIFSIIVNNYDGAAGNVVRKMYKVLDLLK